MIPSERRVLQQRFPEKNNRCFWTTLFRGKDSWDFFFFWGGGIEQQKCRPFSNKKAIPFSRANGTTSFFLRRLGSSTEKKWWVFKDRGESIFSDENVRWGFSNVMKFRIDPNLPRTRIHPASSIIIHHPSIIPSIWSNYSDREREIPLFQGISRLVKYYYIWPAPSFESSHKFLVGLFGIFHLFCSGG